MAMNDSQLTTQANVIKNETATGANTATRVGTMLDDIISNKINNDKIDTNGTLAANSDALVASQKATKTYVDNITTTGLALKEDTANKSNAALGTSATLFPTQNAVKTYVDGQVVAISGSITSGLALKENSANKSNGPLGVSAVLFPTENSVTTALVPKENISDKITTQATFISNGSSVVKYPAIKAVKDYVDSVTTGLLRDAGNFTPSGTSPGTLYPTIGTGPGGAIVQGDTYFIDTDGFFGTDPVTVGASIRAVSAPPTSPSDWSVLDASIGIIPENSANKSTDGTFNSGSPSNVLFPTQSAVATYFAANASDLDQVLTAGNVSTSSLVIGNTLTTPTLATTLSPGVVQLEDPGDGLAVYSITGITLDDSTATNQMVINYNNNNQTIDFPSGSGTLALTSAIPVAGWGLTGNAGTTAGTNFIGTTDAEDVIFKANGVERLKIDNVFGDVYTTNSFRAYNLSASTSIQALGAGGSYAIMGQDSATYGGGFLGLGNTGGRNGVIRCDNITLADREYQLPDANGTFVLSVNGSAPDPAGNITIALSTPSLSAVTAVGNTTTSDIIINGVTGSKVEVDSAGDGLARIGYTSSWKGHLLLSNGTSSGVIRANNITASRTLQFPDADGTIALLSDITGGVWSTTGNAGTNVTTNFIGTTDNKDLKFRTDNVERMILSNAGQLTVNGNISADVPTGGSLVCYSGLALGGATSDPVTGGALALANVAGKFAQIKATLLTGANTYELPDQSGIIALTSDIVESYKSYIIRLGWDGANWTATTIYQNTLGGTVTLSNSGGTRMILTSSGLFTLGKTVVIPVMVAQAQTTKIGILDLGFVAPTVNEFYIRWNDLTGTLVAPLPFGSTAAVILEVRVYP